MYKAFFACLLLLVPGVARAEWLEASSRHFIVYANDSERDIRRFAEKLERYDSAMAYVLRNETGILPSPSSRVTVFVVRSDAEVRRLYGAGSKNIAGFYVPRAAGSLAVVPQIEGGTQGDLDFSMVILLHEYAHHFLMSSSSFPAPRWLSEGGAEFFSSAKFETNGDVWLGRPAQHRAGELFYGRDVKAEDLLDPEAYDKRRKDSLDAFYGKSWLLYHYLAFDAGRAGQMTAYLRQLTQGKSSREAGLAAFGDFAKLERDIDSYLNKNRMMALRVPSAELTTGQIDVRPLRAGEAAMMPVRIRSTRGVNAEQAAALLIEARTIAAGFGTDPAVQSALAEAEYDAGNDKEAIAAAEAALALDPRQVNAYVQKGLALFRMAPDADDIAAAYARARAPFIALNKLENDHPLPLFYFYRSYVSQGRQPTPLAVQGLQRAVQLAPFDLGLRMTLADQELRSGNRDAARLSLAPVAYNPHGGGLAKAAQRAIARIDSDPKWDGHDGLESFREGEADESK